MSLVSLNSRNSLTSGCFIIANHYLCDTDMEEISFIACLSCHTQLGHRALRKIFPEMCKLFMEKKQLVRKPVYIVFVCMHGCLCDLMWVAKSSPGFSQTKRVAQSEKDTGRKTKHKSEAVRKMCLSCQHRNKIDPCDISPYQRYLPTQISLQPRLKWQNIQFLVSSHVIR